MAKKDKLAKAKINKNDEFYTQYEDIQREVNAYLEYNLDIFKDKTILLPCDDPEWSNFTKFFAQNFERFGLKKLISTSYANDKKSSVYIQLSLFEENSPQYDKKKTNSHGKIFILDKDTNKSGRTDIEDLKWKYLDGDGDFRSDEVKKLRDEADIIITNPPFSLFREFVAWIMEADKKFLIIGNQNAITYKEIFPLLKSNRIWLGSQSGGQNFKVPYSYSGDNIILNDNGTKIAKFGNICWFTNLEHGKRHQPLQLMTMADNLKFSKHKEIKENGYQRYDNYDAMDVPYTDAIPSDYDGLMGVPISFLTKYNPEQFEIVGMAKTPLCGDLRTKIYGQQIQHSLKRGKETLSNVSKLNDGPAILLKESPSEYPYYEVNNNFYISTYARILIKHKEVSDGNNIKN